MNMMGNTEILENILSLSGQLATVAYSVIPALFGLFMVLWGVFLNDWDWILILVGLGIFLGFGWSAYRACTGKKS
jgi:hypothetical protein